MECNHTAPRQAGTNSESGAKALATRSGEACRQFQKNRFAGTALIASRGESCQRSKTMRHLGIACGGDDNYATGIAVALYSALSNLSTQVTPTVYVMDGGLSSEHRERLEHVITRVRPDSSIVWCRISADELAKLPSYGYLSQSTYLRLFVGQFVQERTQRIVYIDCDLLVVGDLSVVLDLDFGDCPIGGVRDFIFDDISHLPQPLPEEQCFPWDPKGGYYQAGVCVIDWPRYSALGVEKKALAFGTRLCEDPAVRSDQDVLNPVLGGPLAGTPLHL